MSESAASVDVAAPLFLLGMPRSGTTWLSQIVESSPDFVVRLSPPYSYDYRGVLTEESTEADWVAVLDGALRSSDRFLTQDWRRESGELPTVDNSHATRLGVKDTRFHDLYLAGMEVLPRARLVYIVRHPAATLWSWRSCKEFPAGADFAAEWRSGACRKVEGPGEFWGFDDWLQLALRYRAAAERDPERYLVVSYRDLVRDPVGGAEQILAFGGAPMTAETRQFLTDTRSSVNDSPYSVFRGSTDGDGWRADFPADILREIERETEAAGLGDLLA